MLGINRVPVYAQQPERGILADYAFQLELGVGEPEFQQPAYFRGLVAILALIFGSSFYRIYLQAQVCACRCSAPSEEHLQAPAQRQARTSAGVASSAAAF
jgi:hypothetical protein